MNDGRVYRVSESEGDIVMKKREYEVIDDDNLVSSKIEKKCNGMGLG